MKVMAIDLIPDIGVYKRLKTKLIKRIYGIKIGKKRNVFCRS